MENTKKILADILDRASKAAIAHAGEIAREVAMSFLMEKGETQFQSQKETHPSLNKNLSKKSRPKRTVSTKRKQASNK